MKIVDFIGQLPVHPVKKYTERDIDKIRWWVIHHAASDETATPESIARFHVNIRDWPGAAYHTMISPEGTVYKIWPMTTRTYCVANGNTHSYCICLLGNRDVRPTPVLQWDAAVEYVRTLVEVFPGRLIYGHKEVPTPIPQATKCPGSKFSMKKFREAVGISSEG